MTRSYYRKSYMFGNGKRAYTLIEVLVSVAIITILISLLLPAIQATREAARRTQCLNNLKQYGLGLHNYISSMNVFPPGGTSDTNFSIHAMMLPSLEQMNLYNSINFSIDAALEYANNHTLASATVSFFWCPSDPLVGPKMNFPGQFIGMTNYAGCTGDDRDPSKPNGLFQSGRSFAVQEVEDGLSSTVAMSEFLVGRPDISEKLRTTYVPSDYNDGPTANVDVFTERCSNLRDELPNLSDLKGKLWLIGQRDLTLYNNVLAINNPSCQNTKKSEVVVGATTATSFHSKGANCLFADGHVRFIRESINVNVWRGLGTRGGGEVLSANSY